MPLIVVVETEQRYVERIVEALSPQGWEVLGVEDSEAALEHKADESASLLVVNGEVPDAAKLVDAYARRAGGPGAVVLVPEDADDGVRSLGADEVLQKPFTDQQIRLAVRRCLVGLSSPGSPEPAQPPPPPPGSSERLTSEDLFGDMVSELESVFKFGDPSATEEDEEVVAEEAEVAVPGAAVEEPVEEVEEAIEEEVEEEVEKAIEEEVEEVAAIAAPPREEPAEEVPVEPLEPEEPEEEEELDVAAKEPLEEELAEELAAEEAAEELVAEEAVEEVAAEADLREAPPTPPPAPRRDPAAALEERIQRAAEEGKRLAAKGARPKRAGEEDLGRSTETLLKQVLEGIDERPRAKRRTAERRATEDEVEELVGSVVGKEEAPEEAEAAPPPPHAEGAEAEPAEAGEEPFLEIYESDEQRREEDEYQTRLKLIWAIILIVVLGLLAFVLVRGMGGEAEEAAPVPPAAVEGQPPPDEAPGEPGGGSAEEDSESAAEQGAASEDSLEQELEAQRRQLQEEIAKSQADAEEDGP